ncbi:MAG TPA: hypothetical protein VGU45_01570 [Microvirga sp.]|jgi:hypothetical protein|nr:hypothetical protein [Microvirga sp.]
MTEAPWWQRFTAEYEAYLKRSDERIREQQDLVNGWYEPHLNGLFHTDDREQAETVYRVQVSRRLAKPMAE